MSGNNQPPTNQLTNHSPTTHQPSAEGADWYLRWHHPPRLRCFVPSFWIHMKSPTFSSDKSASFGRRFPDGSGTIDSCKSAHVTLLAATRVLRSNHEFVEAQHAWPYKQFQQVAPLPQLQQAIQGSAATTFVGQSCWMDPRQKGHMVRKPE